MGLFSIFKSNAPAYSDKVWKMKEYALKGLMTDALLCLKNDVQPVLSAFFSDGIDRVKSFLENHQVPYQLASSSGVSGENTIRVLPHDVWRAGGPSFTNSSRPVRLLMLGHYPLPEKEKVMLQRISKSADFSITFYSSLEDPVMKPFNAERIIDLMTKMGMKDEEAIEHGMVTRSMERAREKIQSQVKMEREAQSEDEWFSKNLPS